MIIDSVDRKTISPRFIFAALIPRVMVFGGGDLGLAKAVRGFVPLLKEEETRALPSEDTASGHLKVWTWLLLDTRPAGPLILALQSPKP